jgi:hypothetical protein
VSAPVLAEEGFRRDLLARALLIRGRFREATETPAWVTSAHAGDLSLVNAAPREWAQREFHTWLARGDGNAVNGLEWWNSQRDTTALQRFRRLCERPAAAAPCYKTFGASAAGAYLALARGDSSAALEQFLATPDTLCICVLHRLTTVRLLHHFGRNAEAATRLRSPIGGLRSDPALGAVLWMLEHGKNAERRGDRAAARLDYERVLGLWRRADPQLDSWQQEARAGLARVRDAR